MKTEVFIHVFFLGADFETQILGLGTAIQLPGIGLVLPMYEGTHPKMRKEFKGR